MLKIFNNKTKYRIVMMVVLAMLLQIVGPVVSDVYAEVMDKKFKIVGERIENGIAYMDWEFTLDPNDKVDEYNYDSNFTLDEEVLEIELEADDGTVIGIYSISKEGKVTVYIDPSLYVDDDEIPIVPGDGGEEESDQTSVQESGDATESGGTTDIDPVDPELQPGEGSNEGNDGQVEGDGEDPKVDSDSSEIKVPNETDEETETSEGIIGKALGLVASLSESVEDWLLGDDGTETIYYSGTIVAEGATENSLFGKASTMSSEGKDLGDIFEFDYLKLGDEYITDGEPVELENGTNITIRYNWDIKNKDAQPGDTASIKIPEIFNSAGDYPLSLLLLSDGETQIGTWTIVDGYLQLNFGEGLAEVDFNQLEETFVEFGFSLNMSKFEEDVVQIIEFGDKTNKTFTLVAKPDITNAKSISKVGIPNVKEDNEGNFKDATSIKWTIDVLNTEGTILEGATVSEIIIPDGLSLDTSSFTITELSMGIDGKANPKGSSISISDPSKDTGFEIVLDSMKPYSGYRIEYTTDIRDFTKNMFENTANLNKGTERLPATGSVGNLTRSAPLEKSGKVLNVDEIEWTIDVNKGGISITNPKVEDILPEGLSIKEVNGIKQVFVYKDNADVTSSTGINITVEGQNLTVTLPEISQNDKYIIKYTTTINYNQVNNGTYQEKNEFTNEAWLYDGEDKIGEEEVKATATTTRKHLLYKDGYNPRSYGDTLSWTISVNQAYHTINNAVLHDIIPEGLEFNKGDVKIEKKTKAGSFGELTGKDKPEISDMDTNRKVTITLGKITDEYRITYTTKITEDGFVEKTSFTNKAWLTGDNRGTGVGNGGTENDPVKKDLTPPDNSYTKTAGNIDYDAKTISWKIEIDPIKEPITELSIVDTFPNKGMIFLPDSLNIKKGSTDVTTGYTLSPNGEGEEAGYHKGFTIVFDSGTAENPILDGEKMVITYKTSFDPQRKVDGKVLEPYEGSDTDPDKKEYKNQATITVKTKSGKPISKDPIAVALDNKNTDSPSWNSGKKEGRRVYLEDGVLKDDWISGKDRLIEWKIYINYLKQDLGENVTVTDTLKYEGKIDLYSVEIKKYSVASSGGGTTDGDIAGVKYTPALSDDYKTLTITFNENVAERYVIIYRTTVPDESQGTYENGAKVDVNGTEYPYGASVSYSKSDAYIEKTSSAGNAGGTVYTDDEIDWTIVINESLSTNMEAVEIVDKISEGMVYKNESLKVYRVNGGANELVAENEYGFTNPNENEDGNELKIKFKNPINHKYIIEYKTIVTATTGTISNSAEVKGTYAKIEKTSGKTYTAKKFGYTGGVLPDKGKIRISKVDIDGNVIENNQQEAQFKLWYDLNGTLVEFNGGEVFTTSKGILEIPNLPLREYEIEEVRAPKGYEILTSKIKVNVDKQYKNSEDNVIVVPIENEKIKVDITGTKDWVDAPENKPSISLQLYRNGTELGDPVVITGNESTPWTYRWEDLDKTDIDGNEYIYTVDEVEVPDYYDKSISADGLTVTNTYTYVSPKVEITGKKVWVKGPDSKPSIKLQLYRNNVPYGDPVELNGTEEEPWTYTWKALDKTDLNRDVYDYRVDEVEEPTNYSKTSIEVSEDGLTTTITNTYGSPKTVITGIKKWINGPSNRPNIKLQLYRDGIVYGDPIELVNGKLSNTWNELDKTDDMGKPYTYTVDEVETPENYEKTISENGLTVTNTYLIPKTSITGTKVWVGGSRVKPTIELQLYQNGDVYGDPVELKDGETEYTWDNLDKTDIDGREYKYTIDEVRVPTNYRKTISEDGLTITNRYVPPYEPPYEPPTKPTDPDPKDPEKPVEPTKPVESEKPTEPPTEPVVPVDPTKPTEPPTDPVVPVEPTDPDPVDPTDPTNPTDPEKPTEPKEPTIKENTPKDTPIVIDPKIPEGTPKIVEEPKNGKVTFDENGKWTYTPNPGFEGKDSFVIRVTHPDGTEEDIFIEINVEAPLGTIETLPKTGEINSILFYLAGLFLILLGIVLRKRIA